MRFVRIGIAAGIFAVSLAIVTLRIHPIEGIGRLVLFVMFTLIGLEVILLSAYQLVTGRLVPRGGWAYRLLGGSSLPRRLASGHVRILAGLLLLVGLGAFITAATVWLSPA